jgi:hypothetical protein
MSRLVSRILLSIFMFPLAGVIYLIQVVVGMDTIGRSFGYGIRSETIVFAVCGGITWLFVALYWCLLWRSSVQWNPHRIRLTWLAAAAALAVGGAIGFLAAAMMTPHDGSSFGAFIAEVVAMLLWVIATVFIWRETAVERAQRVARSSGSAIACPNCGYNLTGLSESRCPECGSKFTLDELIAAQPNNKVEIE